MKNALIYARVSTEEQAEKGKSIETQIRLCKKWARENGYRVVGIYVDEGKSATNLNRPALQDLLNRCKQDKEIDSVLVQDTDRLARNTLDHLTIKAILKKCEVKIISISQPLIDDSPEGNLIDTILASVNAFQSQITGRKTSKVMEEKAKLGWFPGGVPPLGYKNIDNPHPTCSLDKRIIEIDEETSLYVKKAFEMYATGNYSLKQLADWLNKKGVRSTTGGVIHPSVVNNILKNPFYIGKFYWKGVLYQGKHKPLVDKNLFERAQEVLAARNQNASRTRKHNFLLRGFVFCADCGRRLWAEKHQKKDGRIYAFYFCPNCRAKTYINVNKLEKQIEAIFQKIELSKEYTKMVLDTARKILLEMRRGTNKERKILEKKRNKLEKALKEAEDARFIHKTLSEEAFLRVYNRYNEELKEIDQKLQGLQEDHSDKVKVLEKILRLAENIGDSYKKADVALKRNYLGLFIKKIKVRNGKISKFYLSDQLKPLIENGSVRVRQTRLPG